MSRRHRRLLIAYFIALALIIVSLFARIEAASAAKPKPVSASSAFVVGSGIPSSFAPLLPERTTADLDAIATTLAGRPIDVHCDTAASFTAAGEQDADGYVAFDTATTLALAPDGRVAIHVRQHWCLLLESLGLRTDTEDRSPNPTQWDIYPLGFQVMDPSDGAAVAILAHEATHVRLVSSDEGLVECANDRAASFAVAPYHLPGWLASRVIWGEHDHHQALPAQYRTDC